MSNPTSICAIARGVLPATQRLTSLPLVAHATIITEDIQPVLSQLAALFVGDACDARRLHDQIAIYVETYCGWQQVAGEASQPMLAAMTRIVAESMHDAVEIVALDSETGRTTKASEA